MPAHVAAADAALAGSLLSAPCDAIKQKMQVSAKRTLGAELRAIARSPRPLAAMFVGYPQFLARDLPFDTIQITTFERCGGGTRAPSTPGGAIARRLSWRSSAPPRARSRAS